MNFYKNDYEYINIVDHILNNKSFNKIKDIEHHGITRYEHSLKVSYYAYKIAKILHLDYEKVARGGLLHDFYISPLERTQTYRFKETFTHPKKAVNNAKANFLISEMEEDIIKSHMFPIYLSLPKYLESWLVSMVDKVVATKEFSQKIGFKVSYAANLYLLFLINMMK